MRTPAQIEASRRNGAKSKGPRTTHNLALANSFTLDAENTEQFLVILENYVDYLQPLGPVENDLVETIAVCKWKQWRILTIEKVTVDVEMQRDAPNVPTYRNHTVGSIAHTLTRLIGPGGSLKSLNIDSLTLDRQYHRSLNMLLKLQDRRPPVEPPVLPASDPEPATEILSGFAAVETPEKNNPTTQGVLETNAAASLQPSQPEPYLNVPIHVHPVHTAKNMVRQAAAFTYDD